MQTTGLSCLQSSATLTARFPDSRVHKAFLLCLEWGLGKSSIQIKVSNSMNIHLNTRGLPILQSILRFTNTQMKAKSWGHSWEITVRSEIGEQKVSWQWLENEIWAARKPDSGAYRALLCSLPHSRLSGSQKPGTWAFVCYSTLGQLLLCIGEQKSHLDTTWNPLSHFSGITGALVSIATYLIGLQTPDNSVPQRYGMPPPPIPCLSLVSVPKPGSWKLAVP